MDTPVDTPVRIQVVGNIMNTILVGNHWQCHLPSDFPPLARSNKVYVVASLPPFPLSSERDPSLIHSHLSLFILPRENYIVFPSVLHLRAQLELLH